MAVAARMRQTCLGFLCTWAVCGVLAGPQREEPLADAVRTATFWGSMWLPAALAAVAVAAAGVIATSPFVLERLSLGRH